MGRLKHKDHHHNHHHHHHKKHNLEDDSAPHVDKYVLFTYLEIPSWLRNNPHIKTGYRAKFTLKLTLLSLFKMHNETMNVWTHLIGFFVMLGITVNTSYKYWDSHWIDKTIFYVFLFSALLCLAASTLYHLLHCHSAKACYTFALIDYTSIAILVVGSFYPTIYYAFAPGVMWQIIYLSVITVLGIAGIIGPFFPKFHEPDLLYLRTFLFFGIAAIGIVPTIHIRWLVTEADIHWRIYGMMASYVFGMIIFLSKFPERFWPGKFDYVFSSHQIWHVFVVLGIYVHHTACVRLYERWLDIGHCDAHDIISAL